MNERQIELEREKSEIETLFETRIEEERSKGHTEMQETVAAVSNSLQAQVRQDRESENRTK